MVFHIYVSLPKGIQSLGTYRDLKLYIPCSSGWGFKTYLFLDHSLPPNKIYFSFSWHFRVNVFDISTCTNAHERWSAGNRGCTLQSFYSRRFCVCGQDSWCFFSGAVSFTVVAIFGWLSAQGNYPWISSLPPDEQSITIEFDKDKEEKEHTINAILPALGLSQPNFSLGSICYPLSTPWNRTTPPIRFVAILRDVVRTFAVDHGIADFDLGTSLRSELNQLFLHILVPKSSP